MNKLTERDRVIHSIVANQIALNHNEELKHTSFYKKRLKSNVINVINSLIKSEPEFDNLFNKQEEEAVNFYKIYEKFLHQVAQIPIYHVEQIGMLIELYDKFPKEVQDFYNKINAE